METIQYKGLDNINDEQRVVLDKLSAEYYDKIKRSICNDNCSIVVHLKKHDSKEGGSGKEKKNAKFSVCVRTIAPTKIFESSAFDWDFTKALHKAFEEMQQEILHYFKK